VVLTRAPGLAHLQSDVSNLAWTLYAPDPAAQLGSRHARFNRDAQCCRTRVPPPIAARAIRSAAEQADGDVTVEEIVTLNAMLRFQRDNMDLEHAERGNHAAARPYRDVRRQNTSRVADPPPGSTRPRVLPPHNGVFGISRRANAALRLLSLGD